MLLQVSPVSKRRIKECKNQDRNPEQYQLHHSSSNSQSRKNANVNVRYICRETEHIATNGLEVVKHA